MYRPAGRRDEQKAPMSALLFPRLPGPLRMAFRFAFAGFVVLLVGTGLLRREAPLIGIVSLGLLVLFAGYLYARHASREVPVGTLLVTAGLSVALGVGWALGADAALAAEGGGPLGIPSSPMRIAVVAFAIPLGFVIGLLAPVVIVRLWRARAREPLHGFLIGSLAGYCFTSAGTLTRLAPEFGADPNPEHLRSAVGMAAAAAIQGIAIPVTAAAVAGAIGATLWFRRPDTESAGRWYAPSSPFPAVAFTLAGFLGLGLLDIVAPPEGVELACYALLAVASLVVLRLVLRGTLEPPADRAPTVTAAPHRPGPVLVGVTAATALVMATSIAVSAWLTPPKPNYVCPPDCGRPPVSKPVATNPRFTPDTGEFSVSYPGDGTAYSAEFQPNGVVLTLNAGDGGVLRLFGEPAEGRTAREITQQLIKDHYRGATTAYEVPNALVGYQLGYGEVADIFPTASVADDSRNRVLVMVAVKNDYALVAAGAGPFHEFSPDFGSGHPSGANFLLALDMGKYVNSFEWRGDPPR